tara:strand:- start:1816 stop:2004 length:189 start_codon:yes stop_codon:yes gene_type:complete
MINKENIVSAQKVNDYFGELSVYKVVYDIDKISFVPHDALGNVDYVELLAWVADGNTIADAD